MFNWLTKRRKQKFRIEAMNHELWLARAGLNRLSTELTEAKVYIAELEDRDKCNVRFNTQVRRLLNVMGAATMDDAFDVAHNMRGRHKD